MDVAGVGSIFTRSRQVGLLLTTLIYCATAVVVYHTIDQDALDRALALPVSVLVAMLGLSLVNYTSRAWRWVFLTRHLELDVPVAKNALYYLTGYALTATPGKAGEAIRLWLLKLGHSIGYTKSLPLMVADRIVDMWAIAVLVFLSMSGFADYLWQSILMGVIVVVGSIPILFPQLLLPLLYVIFEWQPRTGRIVVRARRFVHSMANSLGPRTYAATLLPAVLGWFAECVALYLVLVYLGAPITVSEATFVFAFSMIIGAISMLPGGLGSTEATMVLLLKTLGVDLGTAIAATAIVRITTFWFAVVLGFVCTPMAINAARRSSQLQVSLSTAE